MGEYVQPVVMLVISAAFGVIGFFLARAFASLDKCATKEELNTVKKDVDINRQAIEKIKSDYITKEDFFREQNKTDGKLDRIMDILLEMKGGK